MPSPEPEPLRCLRLPLHAGTPRNAPRIGAGLVTRSVPQSSRPAPEGAMPIEEGPARTLNRQSWFHVQAWNVDMPRLSACTGKVATIASLQGAVSCHGNLAGRSRDTQPEQVRVRGWPASP